MEATWHPLASPTPCAAAGLWSPARGLGAGQPQEGLRRGRPCATLQGSPPQGEWARPSGHSPGGEPWVTKRQLAVMFMHEQAAWPVTCCSAVKAHMILCWSHQRNLEKEKNLLDPGLSLLVNISHTECQQK